MIHRILARILGGLGAVFPEFRAHPAHALTCQEECDNLGELCVEKCLGDPTCLANCRAEVAACLAACP